MRPALFLVLALAVAAFAYNDDDLVLNQKLVEHINTMQKDWTASLEQGTRVSKHMTYRQARGLMGSRPGRRLLPRKTYDNVEMVLPTNFDSAQHWSQCMTINQIRDQSACGSCWAFGAAEAMSDRYCTILGSQGTQYNDIEISAGDLMSCCSDCGDGCDGGFPAAAWQYWVDNGLPTRQCEKYPFPNCEHHIPAGKYPKCPSSIYPTPQCNSTCDDGSTPTLYYGSTAYQLSGEADLKKEIYQYGPVEVAFTVYEDFLTYKSGVYRHVTGSALGGHAVKMTGWGVTASGTPYWIINNSWNSDWGMNGQFWILRGQDECGIEDEGAAGQPKSF